MNDMYEYLLKTYGSNEPILIEELNESFEMSPTAIRQTMKRLVDKGLLYRVENGIYFLPRKNSVLKKPILSVDKIVAKKYLGDSEVVEGYKSGTNFANSLGLTTQTASIPTIITNKTASFKREVHFYNKHLIIKKPKVRVNKRNYKILQVLDLLNDYERVSESPFSKVSTSAIKYLRDVKVDENELKNYLEAYPAKAKARIYESGVYDAITQR